jgi:hypothetical protein
LHQTQLYIKEGVFTLHTFGQRVSMSRLIDVYKPWLTFGKVELSLREIDFNLPFDLERKMRFESPLCPEIEVIKWELHESHFQDDEDMQITISLRHKVTQRLIKVKS